MIQAPRMAGQFSPSTRCGLANQIASVRWNPIGPLSSMSAQSRFHRKGRLDPDAMVTNRGRPDDINEAFRAMRVGEVARTVLTFD
jgi:Zn-dependent alcohol dehydrogenase